MEERKLIPDDKEGRPFTLKTDYDCEKCGDNIPCTQIISSRGFRYMNTNGAVYTVEYYLCYKCQGK